MNQTGLNMLDLMMGPVEQTQVAQVGITGEQVDSKIFGNMLDSLIAVPKTDQFPGMESLVENDSEMNFSNILNENRLAQNINPQDLLLNSNPDSEELNLGVQNKIEAVTLLGFGKQNLNDNQLLGATTDKPNISNLNYKNSANIISDVTIDEALATNNANKDQTIIGQAETENIKNFNKALAELMPLNTGSNKQINELINQVPVTLESGSYKIIESKVNNGTLELSVVSDSKSEPIKISLPLEQLQKVEQLPTDKQLQSDKQLPTEKQLPIGSKSELLAQRINLGTNNQQKIDLENLISKLNLKELTIENNDELLKSDQSKISNSKSKLVNIEISAENSGQIQLIKGKLLKNSVRATQKSQNNLINNISRDGQDLPNFSKEVIADKTEAAFDKQFIMNNNFGREQLLNLTNQPQNIVNENSQLLNSESFAVNTNEIESLVELNKTASSKHESQPVKYNLPDDIRTALKPNGKSINILIDPENLGPARLKLVMHNQTLRAELIVHSPQAKAVVENSLSQLIEQLNRSDIKVEFINVNVNSENNQEQFAHRHPQWSQKSFSDNLVNQKDDTLAYMSNEEIPVISNKTYISSTGVNVLA